MPLHPHTPISRRRFIALGAAAGAGLLAACNEPTGQRRNLNDGRLASRPGAPTGSAEPGLHALGLADGLDGLYYVPAGYSASAPAPLLLALHGAGGRASNGIGVLQPYADARGMVMVATDARENTWDAVYHGFGADVTFIDRALAKVFDTVAIDPARIFIEGFSDGATYALSLGLTNGDLFSKIVAFSAGFVVAGELHGKPDIFVSHGSQDTVLPINDTSRRFVPTLRDAGYDVHYREFVGGHGVPTVIREEAVDWLFGTTPAR
jgi:predicted esterase